MLTLLEQNHLSQVRSALLLWYVLETAAHHLLGIVRLRTFTSIMLILDSYRHTSAIQ